MSKHINRQNNDEQFESYYLLTKYINLWTSYGFNSGGFKFAMGSCGPLGLLNIIASYNVKAYEVRSLSKSGDFSEIDRFVYI